MHLVLVLSCPFHSFQSVYALIVQHVRPSPRDARRLVCAVHIDNQMILCGNLRAIVFESRHILVVPVEEVHFEALHAHLGIMAADILHILLKCQETCPENDIDTLRLGILHYAFEVDLRIQHHQVLTLACSPAVVHNDIFNTVGCGEIDIIFICLSVDSGLEIHALDVPVIPPVPSHFARLYPGCVLHFGRLCQQPGEIAFGNCKVAAHYEKSPRESPCPFCLCDVIFALGYHKLDVVVASGSLCFRILGLHALERCARIRVEEEEAREGVDIDFAYADFQPFTGIDKQRGEGEPARIESGKFALRVDILEGIEILGSYVSIGTASHIRGKASVVVCKIHLHLFAFDDDSLFP